MIRDLLAQDPTKAWTVREVQDRARTWSGTIISLALMDMRRCGEIDMGDDLRVKATAS